MRGDLEGKGAAMKEDHERRRGAAMRVEGQP